MSTAEAPIEKMIIGSITPKSVKVNEDIHVREAR